MIPSTIEIRPFDNLRDRDQVVALWKSVFGYQTAHNTPELVIDKKVAAADGLLFVAAENSVVVGTVMAGYDGHRGWIYSLAVLPDRRKKGIGSELLRHVEVQLSAPRLCQDQPPDHGGKRRGAVVLFHQWIHGRKED